MTEENDRFSQQLRNVARDYNRPPELTSTELDAMWAAIEQSARGGRTRTLGAADADGGARAGRPRWLSVKTLASLAAVLLIGIAIGRLSARRPAPGARTVAQSDVARSDSVSLPEPYQSTTSRYLGQTAALLVSLPAEVRGGIPDDRFIGRAHDLLLTTRLLLDSPAAADPRFRGLLEDLELVLAQIVQLQARAGGSDMSRADLDLISQALEQGDVLPRLRIAVADISADN